MKSSLNNLLLFSSLYLGTTSLPTTTTSNGDGIVGSGYGCNNPCDNSDVNYVIEAVIRDYPVKGYTVKPDLDGKQKPKTQPLQNSDVRLVVRTFVGGKETKSKYCDLMDGYDGQEGFVGPCLQVLPGQSMSIKLINKLDNGMEIFNQTKTKLQDYYDLTSKIPYANTLDHGKYTKWFGKPAKSAKDMDVLNTEDFPGYDETFDDTNLHFHGMKVAPHLFYPQGTSNPEAPWITTKPETETKGKSCFCYKINVPKSHST
eukprot:Pgem_evm1s20309